MIIRFAGFGGQGIVLILRVIACYDRKITRPINSRSRQAVTRYLIFPLDARRRLVIMTIEKVTRLKAESLV